MHQWQFSLDYVQVDSIVLILNLPSPVNTCLIITLALVWFSALVGYICCFYKCLISSPFPA